MFNGLIIRNANNGTCDILWYDLEVVVFNAVHLLPGYVVDGLTRQDGMMFSTFDKDNDTDLSGNCADRYGGAGWGYEACMDSNLNGRYYNEGSISNYTRIYWRPSGTRHIPNTMKKIVMRVKPAFES